MPKVLTTASNVTCGHSGTVQTASAAKLTVNSSPVLLKTSVEGKSVSTCSTTPASDSSGPTAKPCSTVSTATAGESTKLKAGGSAVMLDTLAGNTDGMVGKVTPQTRLSATAVQNKLTSV